MDDLNQKFEDLSLSWIPNSNKDSLSPKQQYINERLNPNDKKKQADLERKLALTWTEKTLNAQIEQEQLPATLLKTKIKEAVDSRQKKSGKQNNKKSHPLPSTPNVPTLITRNSKVADYIKELESEFDELEKLTQQENKTLESYANKYFKPIVAVKGLFESEEGRLVRQEMENKVARLKFIKDHREEALLYALRSAISKNMKPEASEKLHKQEKIQAMLDNPKRENFKIQNFYTNPSLHNNNSSKISDNPELNNARKEILISLNAKLQAKLQPQDLFSKEALTNSPQQRTISFSKFKDALTTSENKVKDEQAIKLGTKKAFKPF